MSDVPGASGIEARLEQAASLPETLAACFDAFEIIRMAARDCQDQVPELFAAFMTAADAAVDGREALTIAPSLPPARGGGPGDAVLDGGDPGQVADALAALASMLQNRLGDAGAGADLPADQVACQEAAHAAARILRLTTRGSP
jgi:hypothetical protein